MFLFNNTKNRDYKKVFPEHKGVIFDLSDKQISHGHNAAWKEIKIGDFACVISGSRKFSTIYKITSIHEYGEVPGEEGVVSILIGKLVAKPVKEREMTALLNKFSVTHFKLPDNKFSMGFNLANLGDQLDGLKVKTPNGTCLLGELKGDVTNRV